MTFYEAERAVLKSVTVTALKDTVHRFCEEIDDFDDLNCLLGLAEIQRCKIDRYYDNPQFYKWSYLDEENNIVELEDLEVAYNDMEENDDCPYKSFMDYLKACMEWNGGTLTSIL